MDNIKIVILSGASADGKTSVSRGSSSKEFGQALSERMSEPVKRWRNWCDIVIVGRATVTCDNPSLVSGLRPGSVRGLIDRFLQLDYHSQRNILDDRTPTIVFTAQEPTDELKAMAGVEFVVLKDDNFFSDLKQALSDKGLGKVLFESGGTLTPLLLEAGIADEMVFAHFPFIVGGTAPTLCDGPGISGIEQRLRLDLLGLEEIDGMITAHYRVNYGQAPEIDM